MAKTGLFGGMGGMTQPTPFNPETRTKPFDLSGIFQRGQGGILPERGSRQQLDLVSELLKGGMSASQNSGSPLLAFLAPMLGGAVGSRTQGLYKGAQKGRDQAAIDQLMAAMGGGQPLSAMSTQSTGARSKPDPFTLFPPRGDLGFGPDVPADADVPGMVKGGPKLSFSGGSGGNWVVDGLVKRGMPEHIAKGFAVNFKDESGFDPTAVGDGGNALGIAQWNGPRKQALESFAASTGRQATDREAQLDNLMRELQGPEASAWQVISQAPDERSAAVAVLNHFERPAEQHRARREAKYSGGMDMAAQIAGGDFSTYAGLGAQPQMSQDNMRTLIGLMSDESVSEPIRDLAGSLLGSAMKSGGGMTPQQQIGLATDMLGLEQAMQPTTTATYRAATPEEAAAYGATAGQIDTKTGRFYPANTPRTQSGADVNRQVNIAAGDIAKRLDDLQERFNPETGDFYTREEAIEATRNDPLYSRQWSIIDQSQGAASLGGGADGAPPPPPGTVEF